MAAETVSVTLPEQLIEEIDELARAQNWNREELVEQATRYYIRERRWRSAQLVISEKAQQIGLRTEDDIEELIDSIRD